ncbi:glycosyltransferase family protein [Pimelobacter simplex]|uniref:glycosyltransferase family protein n=1 Tax=Nocardioides simplex TaxID=2045 RepID=UPI003AAA70C3
MKVLALTARRNVTARRMRRIRERLGLGHDVTIDLVTVHPQRGPLPVASVFCVDPSVLPFRPLVPVAGPGLDDWGGLRRLATRAARLSRSRLARVPRPERWRGDPETYLATAAATSSGLRRLAEAADVVVALDDTAARAAWQLSRRVEHPVVVAGADNVRNVLAAHGRAVPELDDASLSDDELGIPAPPELPAPPAPEPARLLIAPANYAGQAHAWAQSVREHVAGATAMNVRAGNLKLPFPTDHQVETDVFNGSLAWRVAFRRYVEDSFTHVVVEANRPIFGEIAGDGRHHVAELVRAGKTVALLSHGSDARIPSVHAARERWHSYDALRPADLRALEDRSRSNVAYYESFDGPVFVSTPGLLAFVPTGTWLPLVIDPGLWHSDEPLLGHALPRVAHIPSSAQKGSHMIDPVLRSMHERGLIEYVRVEGVPHDEMPALYGSADIVVEQFGIADYSTAACEAMAAGRVVVSRVADEVRTLVAAETGLELPVVEANPETLEQVVLDLVADPDRLREIGAQGQRFCREVHDGRRAAGVLGAWLTST